VADVSLAWVGREEQHGTSPGLLESGL
jgi:hypothetical protein